MTSMDVDSPTTPTMAITPVIPSDNDDTPLSNEQPNKRRRKKSIVWEHFTIETVGAGCMRACCKQCKKSFAYITGSKLAGTSHLKRHIALGICPVSRQKNEASQFTPGAKSDPPKRRYRTSPGLGSIPFDQDRCNQDVAKMIIQHEYPLHIVEHPAFVDFVRTLQPQYNMVSFNTIQGECVALYLREKQSLLDLISGLLGRVNLTLDLRTSNLNFGYAFITGHFIDDDWNLHRRILNVVMLPFPDSDYAFYQAVVSCISDWHLENRLFTLTLDQSFSNDNIIGNLRGLLSVKNLLVLNGQLLKGNCYARVLSRLAQDALSATADVIKRIRESVKYVKTSDTHDEKFAELRQRLQVPSTRDLIIDDQSKWDTTYHMLVAACELKEVFACLDTTDPVYRINPSMDDWKQVEILCTYLKLLYDAASILTGPTYPPANAFYHEVSKIQLELTHAAMSQDPFVSNLAKPLKAKFDQYWRDCFLVLALAIVMDPRFKMKLVEFSFSRIFGEDAGMWIKIVDDGIHELYLDYLPPSLSVPATFMGAGDASIPQSDIFQEAPPQGATSQEASFQAFQVAHSTDVAPQEVDSQGTTIQELQPEDVASEVQPNEESLHDASPHVVNHQEVASQEMNTQEVPVQETLSQDLLPQQMSNQELPLKAMDNQELPAQEMDSQEVPAQEMNSQDVTMQEMHTTEVPVQEMHTQEGDLEEKNNQEVSSQEMQAEKSVPTEGMQAEESVPIEGAGENVPSEVMQAGESVPTEGKQAGESVPTEGMQAEESVPTEGMQAEESVPTEGMQADESVPTEGMQAEESVPTEGMQAEESVPTEGMQAEESLPTEGMQAEESVPNEGMQADESVPTEGMQAEESVPTEGMQAEESVPTEGKQTQNMQAQEKPTQEVQAREHPAQEMQAQVKPTQEMQVEEKSSQEKQGEEKPTQEVCAKRELTQVVDAWEKQSEEIHALEKPTEEKHSQEVPTQITDAQEVPTQEMHPQEYHNQQMLTQDIHSQEMQPQEAQTQEMHLIEGQTQEMHPPEAQIHEMHRLAAESQGMCPPEAQTQGQQLLGHEVHLSEGQAEEMHPSEGETNGIHSQEAETHEMQPQEVQPPEGESQDSHFQAVHYHDLHHQEVLSQEMHSHGEQTQEMDYQSLSHGMQSHEMHTQDLPLLSIGDGLQDFEVYISEIASSQHLKSELDQYLEESLLPRVQDFDVLGWWKLNKLKYPTLARMAADILSIPVSTVAPESVFDTRTKKIDNYRSSLRPVTLEALVCAKDWLQYGSSSSSLDITNALVKMEY